MSAHAKTAPYAACGNNGLTSAQAKIAPYAVCGNNGLTSAHAKTAPYAACGNNGQERNKFAYKTKQHAYVCTRENSAIRGL